MQLTGAALKPATARKLFIPSGLAGVKRTLALMVDITRKFKEDLNVNQIAAQLTMNYPKEDRASKARALQHYVRDRIKYVEDIANVETLRTPVQTLKLGFGDCDDKAMLLNALAGSVGFHTRFCAVGVQGVNGGAFSHVMSQIRIGSSYINAETTVPGVELGWFPPDATCVMLAHVE